MVLITVNNDITRTKTTSMIQTAMKDPEQHPCHTLELLILASILSIAGVTAEPGLNISAEEFALVSVPTDTTDHVVPMITGMSRG
jgi:hypothetical protein